MVNIYPKIKESNQVVDYQFIVMIHLETLNFLQQLIFCK